MVWRWRLDQRRRWASSWKTAQAVARLTRLSSVCYMPSIARRCQWLNVIQLMFSCRQTSAGLHRSVHSASTAWTLSGALCCGAGVRIFRSVFSLVVILVEVIGQFLFVVLLIVDGEFELALLGVEHDGLAVHATDHVERRLGFAAQRQFEELFLNARLDGFAQGGLDLEEAVGGAQSVDANSKGKGDITLDQEEAVSVMLEKYEQVCAILHGFDYAAAAETTAAKRLPLIAQAAEHVLQQKDGKPRFLLDVTELSKALALAAPHDSAHNLKVGAADRTHPAWWDLW